MILTFLNKYRDAGLLFLRVGFGLAYIFIHGLPKILGGPERWEKVGSAMGMIGVNFAPKFWGLVAGCSELVGGLFLILGFFFRPACMLIAYVMFMAVLVKFGRGQGIFGAAHALENGIVLIALILIGPGKHALDEILKRSRNNKQEQNIVKEN
jgi:putative oxidoreductase